MSRVRVGGTWRDIVMPHTRVGGTWRPAKAIYNKVAGKWYSSFLQGGINDFGFTEYDTGSKLNGPVRSIAVQADGKMLFGGGFSSWSGVSVGNILRLNSNETLDTSFNTNVGTAANGNVRAIRLQANGQILVGGEFTTWNGATVGRIVRLNSDGTRDTTFTTNTGTGAASSIHNLVIQSDGKIIVGGNFTTWNGVTSNYIVRLNSDGTRDTTFGTNIGTAANSRVWGLAVQSNGQILVGGEFSSWGGVTVGRVVRLNSDGTRDTTFTTNTGTGAGSRVESIAIQSDGKIVVGGGFSTWNGTTVNNIVCLNSNGTRDTAFNVNTGTAADNTIVNLFIQANGQILVGGEFTTWNGATVGRIVRLNSDGTRDNTFTTNNGTGADSSVFFIIERADNKIFIGGWYNNWNSVLLRNLVLLNSDGSADTQSILGKNTESANSNIQSIAVQSDGKIIVGGNFTTWNGVTVNGIVRLNFDGTRDTSFTTNTGGPNAFAVVEYVLIKSDGKILVGGNFNTWGGVTVNRIVQLNSDGTRDTTFTTNTGTAANNTIEHIFIQANGQILVSGQFTTWNGVTVNRIVRLNSDGTRDTTFTTNAGTAAGSTVFFALEQSNGQIVVGGNFTTWNGVTSNYVVRLNSNGTRDTTFGTNIGTAGGNRIFCGAIQANGQILLGGDLTSWNGSAVGRIVRLNSNGTRDTAFTTNTGTNTSSSVEQIVIQANGQIIVGGNFETWNGATVGRIVRLNSDGTRDTAFNVNSNTGFSDRIKSIFIQADSKIVVGGDFTAFNNINRSRIARIGGELAI